MRNLAHMLILSRNDSYLLFWLSGIGHPRRRECSTVLDLDELFVSRADTQAL